MALAREARGQQRFAGPHQEIEGFEHPAPGGAVGAADPVAHALGRRAEQFLDADPVRVAGRRAQRHQRQQRHHDGAGPVGHLAQVEEEPSRQVHDLDRHGRAARQGTWPKSASWMRVKTLLRSAPPRRQDGGAGAEHVRRVGRIADAAQRVVGFDAGARGRTRRRGTAASRRARPGCGADRRRSCARARGRSGRDSARAGRIRPGWSRRPRARTPNGRPAR